MDADHLLRTSRRYAGLSQRAMAARSGVSLRTIAGAESGARGISCRALDQVLAAAGLDVGLVPALPEISSEELSQHLHLSLTQRLRLALGEPVHLRTRPKGATWADLVMLTRRAAVVLEPPLAHALWVPLGSVADVAVTVHAAAPLSTMRIRVRASAEPLPAWLVPVTVHNGQQAWVAPPAVLAMPDEKTAMLRLADALLHAQAPLDDAARRRPAHRDPREYNEDWRSMVTKAIRPEQRPDVHDGRAWRLGAAASLAQRLRER